MRSFSISAILCATTLVALPLISQAGGRVAFEYGTAADAAHVKRYGGTAALDWNVKWLQTGDWYLGGYWEAGVDYWDGRNGRTGNDSLVDFHITPVFRWQRDPNSGLTPFVEFGIGPHGMSETKIDNKDFDIGFAFGSHIGGGLRFGDHGPQPGHAIA